MWVWSVDREDSLEKEMATHSSILQKIPQGRGPSHRLIAGAGYIIHLYSFLKFCLQTEIASSFKAPFFFFLLSFPCIKDSNMYFLHNHQKCGEVWVAQSCLTLCDPMDCGSPGSSVYEILQARIWEWLTIPFSEGSSWSRDRIQVSCIAAKFFTVWATRERQV